MHSLFRRRPQASRASTSDDRSSSRAEDVVRYTNCKLLRDGALRDEDLWVQEGRVVSPQELFWGGKRKRALADTVVDCEGMILSAGLIDLQVAESTCLCCSSSMEGDTPPLHACRSTAGGVSISVNLPISRTASPG